MKTSDFHYDLPGELIAQAPLPERSQSRMMVLSRSTGQIEHGTVGDIPRYLDAGDLLVMNNTRVISARITGARSDSGGKVELLLLEKVENGSNSAETWQALYKASRPPRPGTELDLGSGKIKGTIIEGHGEGRITVRLESDKPLESILEEEGIPPLPPYIRRERGGGEQLEMDRDRYQTVYAKEPGAVAAPTAGLHLTPQLLQALRDAGVSTTEVTLHVGIGTFKPVKVENVSDHVMEEERYNISSDTADIINATRGKGGRIAAVGTTTVRTLETVAAEKGEIVSSSGRSSLFITPPYEFRAVDVMLTNFHLPCSTLIMMVSAFAGREMVMEAYRKAVEEKYRFYSYGDCMLIL